MLVPFTASLLTPNWSSWFDVRSNCLHWPYTAISTSSKRSALSRENVVQSCRIISENLKVGRFFSCLRMSPLLCIALSLGNATHEGLRILFDEITCFGLCGMMLGCCVPSESSPTFGARLCKRMSEDEDYARLQQEWAFNMDVLRYMLKTPAQDIVTLEDKTGITCRKNKVCWHYYMVVVEVHILKR